MLTLQNKNHRLYLTVTLIVIFSLFALYLRIIPMLSMGSTDILNVVGSDDPLYNLRQVEQMLHNFPDYAWFDAMTHFPNGDFIYWGPVFTHILTTACMILGASARPEIIGVCLLVPVFMGVIMVPVMYFVGKSCGDWKTGLLASGFIAIVSGQYFYRSFYGYLDHHIAEVLFSTLFCLVYIMALQAGKEASVDFKRSETIKRPAFFALLAGIAYLLGLFTMPTMILFAMIVAIFTLVQFLIDFYRGDSSGYLLLINSVVFIVAIIGLLLFGIKSPDQLSLAVYSYSHIFAYLGLVGGTLALYGFARYLEGKNKHMYPLAIAGVGIIATLILLVVSPDIFNILILSFFAFFGQSAEALTVQEAQAWTIANAWTTFNYGLILMALGLCVLAYKNVREEHPHQIFALTWSAIILVSAWQHIRYEYYLAVNITLLAAVVLSFAIDLSSKDLMRLAAGKQEVAAETDTAGKESPEGKRPKKGKKERVKKVERRSERGMALLAIFILVAALSALFVITSVNYSYSNAIASPIRMNADWRESLEWLGNSTPATGVDYYALYDQKTYRYPASAYGIMSWWDYGHMITFISKRIPNANPFQRGVAGEVGAAAFFMTTSEDAANAMADQLGTRYVITDIEMDMTKFPAMSVWFNNSVKSDPYLPQFAIQDPANPNTYQSIVLANQSYYLTMVSRLHNFDGSIGVPDKVYYIEYLDTAHSHTSIPEITNAEVMNATDARARADRYNLDAPAGHHAMALSPGSAIYLPVETVPALRHYRLVHESPTNVYTQAVPDIKYVKVFEYVKGAHIRGEGIIEVPVVTNTGRTFTYRQQSINGEFIVPYPTTGSPYEVRAAGKYKIVGTGKLVEVPEEAVMNGLTIQ